MRLRVSDFLLFVYRLGVSPAIHWICGPGSGCRFVPSCSHYTHEAIEKHGMIQGAKLSFLRICRCHPFSHAGYDPVPHAIDQQNSISNLSTEGKKWTVGPH